jgi:hypothetical protein
MITFLILTIPFLIGYLFLPKVMWQHYFADTTRFAIMGVAFFILFGLALVTMKHFPWGIFGFWLMDPISYTMIIWPRIKRQAEAEKRTKDQLANLTKNRL